MHKPESFLENETRKNSQGFSDIKGSPNPAIRPVPVMINIIKEKKKENLMSSGFCHSGGPR